MVRHPMGDEVKLHEKAGWHSLAQLMAQEENRQGN